MTVEWSGPDDEWDYCPKCGSYFTGRHQCPKGNEQLDRIEALLRQILSRLEAIYPTQVRLRRDNAPTLSG